MTRAEIIEYMRKNPYSKIKHMLFDPDEYLYMVDSGNVRCEKEYLFEDWYSYAHNGMRLRSGGEWEKGWTIVGEKHPKPTKSNTSADITNASTTVGKTITFSFELNTKHMRHLKDKSRYNHNYYQLNFDAYGDLIIHEKADILLEECEDDAFATYYTLGYFDDSGEFIGVWKWLEDDQRIKSLEAK